MKVYSIVLISAIIFLGIIGCANPGPSRHANKSSVSKKIATKKSIPAEVPLTDDELDVKAETLAHYATGLSHELNNHSDEAAAEYLKAANADPGYEPLVLDVSRRLIREQKTDKAIELLEKATALPSASGTLDAWLAVAYSAVGKNAAAIDSNRVAIKKMPKNLAAYQNLGQIYLQTGQTNQALLILKQAAAQKDVDAEFLLGLADVFSRYSRQKVIPEEEAKGRIIETLERAAALKPSEPFLLQRLGDSYLQMGEAAKAEPFFTQIFERFPEAPGLRERMANLYLRTGNKEKATKLFEGIRRNRPTDPQPYFFLGSLAYEEKEYDKASDYYETAIRLNPDYEPLYYDLAGVLLAMKKPAEALETLEKARKLFKLNFTLEFYAGVCNSVLQKYPEALSYFTSAELVAKRSEPAKLNHIFYYQLGSTYERNGNFKEAEKAFRKAIEIAPKYAEALNYLGYMWAERGENLEEARKMLDLAVELEPKNAAFLDSMAWVHYKSNRPSEALTWMLKAIANSEKPDATLYDHLGDIYLGLKQFDHAREAWSQSVKLESTEAVKKKLQTLPAK